MYVVTGCLQGCLLVMGVYFEYQARKGEEYMLPREDRSAVEDALFRVGAHIDTDDEGHHVVENGVRPPHDRRSQSERTPLLHERLRRKPSH